VSSAEHLLVAETGTDDRSRYAIMVGVSVDDPEAVAERLTDASDNRVLAALCQVAFEIRIAFASEQKVKTLGEDWRYAFLKQLTRDSFNPNRQREIGYQLVAHLPEGLPFDFEWLDAYLTTATYGMVRVRTKTIARDERILLLPRLVARVFHDAIEDDSDRPSAARDRYDVVAPLVTHVEDMGLNVSYCHGGTAADAIVRTRLSS
jgi:hypothetical protein